MGNYLSVEQCVSLENSTIYTESSYTVERTSGAMETGWVISKPRIISSSFPSWIKQHATKQTSDSEWRIFMHNGSSSHDVFLCGWRRLETIHPSNLTDAEEIRIWRDEFLKHLEILNNIRLKELG